VDGSNPSPFCNAQPNLAIIEAIEAGKRDHAVLVRKATVKLMAAIKVDPEAPSRAG
jgi:hypothetical protein